MPRHFLNTTAACLIAALPFAAHAETVWVQIAARPNLPQASQDAAEFAQSQDNVAGFYIGSGWYAIALGPYERADAESLLARLKLERAIPNDSFIATGGNFRNQYFPVGTGAAQTAQPLPEEATTAPTETPVNVTEIGSEVAAPEPNPVKPVLRDAGETKAEARASESELTRDDKRDLQVALKWAGHYSGAIDGLYGRGTRNSMAAWQAANEYPETGILTTLQRAELLAAYNAILDGMGLQVVQDDAAGIRMQLPMGVVAFNRYDPPFVRFDANGDLPVQVLLISQEGDAQRMAGLFEIMQTLEIVPREGARALNDRSFTLEGLNDQIHSHTEVTRKDGHIKGFTLIWPAGDEQRRSRVLEEMRDSFETFGGALDAGLVSPGAEQAADLISGMAVRKPRSSTTGFFVNDDGTVITTASGVATCGQTTIDGDLDVTVAYTDADLDLAVLTPSEPLSPPAVATFQTTEPRLQSQVALAGFPFGGVLPSAAMTFGRLEDVSSLAGNANISRLSLHTEPSELGGPVFDNGGRVMGMLVSGDGGSKQLPAGVGFALESAPVLAALDAAGIKANTTDDQSFKTEELITQDAAKMTVLVRCWD